MGRRKLRGIALISTFLFVGLLFMMAASMVVVSRSRVFTGISQHHQAQSFYLAEAGLAKAMVALENDLNWPGVTDATIDGMPGTYTVFFDDSDKYGSVNNIGNDAAVDSYRGPGTVPINTAVLVVQANVSGHRYVLEALVDGQGSIGYMSDAILTSGKVRAEGAFHIDGISGLEDATPVDGSIQSNLSSGDALVSWNDGGDSENKAYITGTVGTGASSSSSIDMDDATILGGPELNANHNIPSEDVVNEIDSNSGAAPDFDNPLSGGKFKVSGDTTVNGDVVLEDGAELYVDGNFTVNGSIKGNGTIYVKGETVFRGDSEVTTNDEFSVSLYSKGNVKLTGFDGTEFMSHVDDETKDLLRASEFIVDEIHTIVDNAATPLEARDYPGHEDQGLWVGMSGLGHDLEGGTGGSGPQNLFYIGDGEVTPNGEPVQEGEYGDIMGQLEAKLNDVPDGETKEFLQDRLDTLQRVFTSADDLETGELSYQEVLDKFDADGSTAGLLDAVVGKASEGDTATAQQYWDAVRNLTKTVSYDKPGAAYFQGAIYTNGFFYADNEINVIGAIIVDGNGVDSEKFQRKRFDTTTMKLENDGPEITLVSGDCFLGNRTRVTYVEEFFTDDPSSDEGPQNLAKALWMGR